MDINERKDMHKAIGIILCFSGMLFALLGVFIEGYTWYLFVIAGVLVVIMLYHMIKYWGPVLEEYKKQQKKNAELENVKD